MNTTTTTTRTLAIDGMSGDSCVQKVTGALKGVEGVTTQSVKVGGATLGATQAGCDAACAAIGTAGFKAREDNRPAGAMPAVAQHTSNPASARPNGAKA